MFVCVRLPGSGIGYCIASLLQRALWGADLRAVALSNGRLIARWEDALGFLPFDLVSHEWLVARMYLVPTMITLYHWLHMPLLTSIWTYNLLFLNERASITSRRMYQYVTWGIIIVPQIFPCAPPRMLSELGFKVRHRGGVWRLCVFLSLIRRAQ